MGARMIKKLTAIGNSFGIIIERPILDLLRIERDTPLEVRTDGEALIIRPARQDQRARVRDAAGRMMDVHDETLRKLAE